MTTRSMVTSLMTECLEDAKGIALDTVGSNTTPDAVATLAAAMFAARWDRGSARLVSAIHRADAAAADGPRTD